jgi:membrane protein implicated in regulation of membrane protease activity
MDWWIWLLIGLALFLVEIFTPSSLFAIFFGFGAVIVGLLAVLEITADVVVQWLLFSAISLASLVLCRPPLMRRLKLNPSNLDIDDLTGKVAIALEDIGVGKTGRSELRGTAWTSLNIGEQPVIRGQRCRIERTEGLTLCVRGE